MNNMDDKTDTREASPRQSFLDTQLSEAISPPAEKEKLRKSFESFCEELDRGESAPEPAKAPAEPAAVEAAPAKQPVTQIALQPAPRPADPDPLDAQARQLEVGAYVTRHPDFKQERIATQRAYEDVVREMSRHFDADPERVKADFTDPLLTSFTPDQLTDEWFQEQVDLMRNASPIIKRKIEAKWLQVQELQARQNKKAQELAANYDTEQQQRSAQNWQAAIMAEARTQLDDESEFRALKDIRDRANKGDPKANAQFTDLEQNVFRPYMVKLLTEHPSTPPGQATRKALRHVKEHLQSKGRKTMASPVSQPSHSSPNSSSQKPLPKNSRASLAEAFDRWTPPAKEDSYWDSVTSSYKRRAR
jgi:hypothetical protein